MAGVPVGDTTLLAKLRELAEKTAPSPLPWRWNDADSELWLEMVAQDVPHTEPLVLGWADDKDIGVPQRVHAELISAAVNAVPAVVTLIEAAQQVVADIEAVPEYRLNPQTEEEIAAALAPFVGEATQ